MTLKEHSPRYESIHVDIRTVAEAKQIIINKARSVVLGVHWTKYGITNHAKVAATFEAFSGLALRQAQVRMPLTIIDTNIQRDRDVFRRLSPTHVMPLTAGTSQYFLALLQEKVTPQDATFVRDYLVAKMPEVIVGVCLNIHSLNDPRMKRILENLYQSNQFIHRATDNVARKLHKYRRLK